MDKRIRTLITDDVLTISEIAYLLGVSVSAAQKRAERGAWDSVQKAGVRLYYRPDVVKYLKKKEAD